MIEPQRVQALQHERPKERMIAHTTLKNGIYPLTFQTIHPDFSLVMSEAAAKVSLSVFSIGEKSDVISVYNWHQTMGHRSTKTIVDTENGVVTRTVLKDVPGDPLTMDSCLSCTLATAQHFLFKTGCTRVTTPLEPIHGNLVGPMPVESVSCCKYRFALMDDYSRTSWVLPLRAKSNAPAEFRGMGHEDGVGQGVQLRQLCSIT